MDQREWNIKINLFQQITSPFFFVLKATLVTHERQMKVPV